MDNKIIVNGIAYIREDSIQEKVSGMCENYHIVRTQSAGVFAGEIASRSGSEIVLKNARRLWAWCGAASLSQLAMEGVKEPENCKFPRELPEVTLLGLIEFEPCSIAAQKSIKEVPVWER